MPTAKSRLRMRIQEEDISWESVLESLQQSNHIKDRDALRQLKNFVRKVRAPVNVQWLGSPALTKEEQEIALALCELNGADVVTILREHSIGASFFKIIYNGEVELDPFAKLEASSGQGAGGGERRGVAQGRFRLSMFGMNIDINTRLKAVFFYILLMLVGIVMYVILAGMLLYAVSVFLLFLADPGLMTVAATTQSSIGLALLCLLIGLAGLSGKAIRNVASLIRLKLRKQAKAAL